MLYMHTFIPYYTYISQHTYISYDTFIYCWFRVLVILRYICMFQARTFFQNEVFAPLVENQLFQEHLALNPRQRVQSQWVLTSICLYYVCYFSVLVYVFHCWGYLFYLWFRWPDKKYIIICPPPVPRKPPSETKAAKQGRKSLEAFITVTVGESEPRVEDLKGVMYYEYDLMFHYLLASLRRADGANSVTASGIKTFNIFAGLGEHR